MLSHDIMYSSLFFITHIWSIRKSCCLDLQNISRIQPLLHFHCCHTDPSHLFPLDYCHGLPSIPLLLLALLNLISIYQTKQCFEMEVISGQNCTQNPQWLPIKAEVLAVASNTLYDLSLLLILLLPWWSPLHSLSKSGVLTLEPLF